ncbi:hypothetical protein FIU94_00200 [Sulfitobacter sp. THAF37]|uniref:DUF4145 domain-containing protein n=1 Tax=Sulfitobacter sp. THAF37 TaxID=2587855 RepID=UPI001268A4BF|nr:DUF4145 domain-containing protein [Sulfitobacter sp. THAF37]QFT57227.1 hypothetical protein FIU94_00200 [Sulfitobacter sp. THAF37]
MRPSSVSIGNKTSKGGTNTHGQFRPKSVNTFCPFCSSKVTFSLVNSNPTPMPTIWPAQSTCPECEESVNFIVYYTKQDGNSSVADISMFPAPSHLIAPVELPEKLPAALSSAVRDAEAAYRAGLYSPAVTCAGRALEGLLKHILREKDTSLYKLIDIFCESEEATKPIKKLSHTMREGRNVAAHFDENIIPDQKSAEIMIELLHYLVSYLFLFSEKAEKLSTKLR